MIQITEAAENYLEAILELEQETGSIRLTSLAQRMNVSKPSAVKAIAVLKEYGFLIQQPYGKIQLTAEGYTHAQQMKTRHIGIRKFLIRTLGVEESVADTDACRIEHVVSMATLERMMEIGEK